VDTHSWPHEITTRVVWADSGEPVPGVTARFLKARPDGGEMVLDFVDASIFEADLRRAPEERSV
jgi:hypothetical protein